MPVVAQRSMRRRVRLSRCPCDAFFDVAEFVPAIRLPAFATGYGLAHWVKGLR